MPLDAAGVRERITRGGTPLDESDYGDPWITATVAEFCDQFAAWAGYYPQPTTTTEELSPACDADRVVLAYSKITSITSVEINGVTLAASQYTHRPPGVLVRLSAVFDPRYPVTVVYVSGLAAAAAPEYIKRACALYVEKVAAADRSGQTADVRASGETTWYVMPNPAKDQPTGWREVDRLLVIGRGQTHAVLA